MSKEVFTVYHCRSCNKIEVTQYISKEQMEELGFTEEELRPICPVTGNSDLEELGGQKKSGAPSVKTSGNS